MSAGGDSGCGYGCLLIIILIFIYFAAMVARWGWDVGAPADVPAVSRS
jgi:hypothetical protein